jgi:hypothetical protein
MQELTSLQAKLRQAPRFTGETRDEAVNQIRDLNLSLAERLSALRPLSPIVEDDGTNTFAVVVELVTKIDLDEEYRYHLVSALAQNRDAERLIASLVADPRIGDGKFKAGFIMRLLDIRLALQSPPLPEALNAVRGSLDDRRPIVRAAAVRHLGVEDPASEEVLISELRNPEAATLPLYLTIKLVDPTKDMISELLLPLLTSDDREVRLAAMRQAAVNPTTHTKLWQRVLSTETDSDFATTIVEELADHQPRDEFLESAFQAIRAPNLAVEVRLKALNESGQAIKQLRTDQQAINQQQKKFESLLQELRSSEATPKQLEEGLRKFLPLENPPDESTNRTSQRDWEAQRAIVTDASATLKNRHAALLALRANNPQFYQLALTIAADSDSGPEFRAIVLRAIAFGLKDGKLSDEQKKALAKLLRDMPRGSAPIPLRDALLQFDRLAHLLPKSQE